MIRWRLITLNTFSQMNKPKKIHVCELARLQRAARKLSYRLDILLRSTNDFDQCDVTKNLSGRGQTLSLHIDALLAAVLLEHPFDI